MAARKREEKNHEIEKLKLNLWAGLASEKERKVFDKSLPRFKTKNAKSKESEVFLTEFFHVIY